MPSLTDPITAATDLGDVALWNLLIDQTNRRLKAVDGAFAVLLPAVAAGDDITDGHFVANTPTGMLVKLQAAVWNLATSFLDVSVTFEGHATETPSPFQNYTQSSIRVAAGLPATRWFTNAIAGSYPHFGPSVETPGAGGTGPNNRHFRRQRYRQITGTDAQYDVWGNAAATGQRAYLCGSAAAATNLADPIEPYVGTRYSGTRWRCVASGNWVRDESDQADLLDNTAAPPDHCGYDSAWDYNGGPLGTGATGSNPNNQGLSQPSDVFSYLQLEEIRRYLVQMTATLRTSFDGGHNWQAGPGVGIDVDEASTKAEALAGYTASATDAATPLTAVLVNSTLQHVDLEDDDPDGENWYGDLTRHKTTVQVTGLTADVDKAADFYVYGGSVPDQSGTNEWDDNGDPVLEGVWHKWATVAATPATSVSATLGSDPATTPPAWPTTPAGGDGNVRGYHGRGISCVLRWSF